MAARASLRRLAPAVLLLLSCAPPLSAQETPTPAAPGAPAPVSDFSQRRTNAPQPSPRVSPARPAVAPRAQPSAPAPAARPAPAPQAATQAQPAPKPPREVVTVVHRLSGWRLLTWLATSGPPLLEIDNLPSALDVHTNIVAGFVHSDGRKVVARLPQGEAEPAVVEPPPGLLPGAEGFGRSEFMVLAGDGRRVRADFVGLDAATGLSVLEASEPLFALAGDEGHTEDPTVGQRVRLYAPAQVAPAPAAAPSKRGAAGDEGVIYLSIDRADGQLTSVTRAPSGKTFNVTARADGVTPAWTGAVATDEAGALVGIVAQSTRGETEIVSGEMVRAAVERVQARRASVPQPWLGVRGDAAFRAPLESWVGAGWNPESARPLMENGLGVLLTAVPPGTPAAVAGLRPGDVIGRVGEREVRTAEDLSLTLKELPVGSTVDFTVWRAFEPEPVRLPVVLRGTQNPALSTAEAEARAARESLLSVRGKIREVRLAERQMREPGRVASEEHVRELSESLRRAERQMEEALARVSEAETRINEARYGALAAVPAPPSAPAAPAPAAAQRPLQTFGLQVVGLTPRSAARLGARGGVLVVSVRPASPAAAGGLRAGDVIETVNGRTFTRAAFSQLARDASDPLTLGVVRLKQRLALPLALGGDPTTEQ